MQQEQLLLAEDSMKAITITQPYATLISLGMKKIETRSWPTSYRGPLAIHAATGLGPVGGNAGLFRLCSVEPFASALRIWHAYAPSYPEVWLPRGAIVAVCKLVACRPIVQELNGDATILSDDMLSFTPILGNERAFGDYSPGRYAWLLADVRALPAPIPARGALGLWEWREMAVRATLDLGL